MTISDESPRWRNYCSWGSLTCGAIALVLAIVFMTHLQLQQQRRQYDPWTGWYVLVVTPISFVGVLLGIIGKEPPRAIGLILSTCILLWSLGGAIAI
jgi:uncharacterized membrane-anchored protein